MHKKITQLAVAAFALFSMSAFPQLPPSNLVVPNQDVNQGTLAYEATNSITTGTNFQIDNLLYGTGQTASVLFQVLNTSNTTITLLPGFTAIAGNQPGSPTITFKALIGPLATPPVPVNGSQPVNTPYSIPPFTANNTGGSNLIVGGYVTFLATDGSGAQCPVEFVVGQGGTSTLTLLDTGTTSDGVCTINAGSSISAGSEVVTVNLNLTFTYPTPETYTITTDAIDTAGNLFPFLAAGTWTVTGPWNFTMTAPSLSSVTVTPTGAQSSYNQTFQGINGFSGPVSLTYKYKGGNLPAGLSFSLNSLTVSGPTAITAPITVSAGYATTAGTYPISITAVGAGSSGTITQTSSVTVVVTQPPSFNISWPTEFQIANNSTWTGFSQIITTTNGFNSPVTVFPFQYEDISGKPYALNGPVNVSYGQQYWTPNPITGTVNVNGMLQSPTGSATGLFYYDCYATGSGVQQYFKIPVYVTSTSQNSDFTLTPGSQSVQVTDGGSSFSFPVTISAINTPNLNWPGSFTTIGTSPPGWPSNVNVAVSPSTFSTLPATAMVTITAYSGAPTGTYSPQISVTATNPNTQSQVTHSTPIALTIGNVPTFTLSASPGSQTANTQGTASYQIMVNGVNGFNGQVSFSTSGLPGGSTTAFTPSLISGSGSAVFTAAVPATTTLATYTVTITAISGSTAMSTLAYLTVPASSSSPATMLTPVPGWNLNGDGGTFTWNAGIGVSQYQILGGSSPGGSDYFALNTGNAKTASVTWPATTQQLYVTLQSLISGNWQSSPYTYSADLQSSHVAPTSAAPTGGGNWVYNNNQEIIYTYLLANEDQGGDDSYYKSCTASDANVTARLVSVTPTSMEIGFTANFSAIPASNETVTCDWEGGQYGSYPTVPVVGGITVYDATPIITEVDQLNSLAPGGQAYITIWGDNFGAAPNPQGVSFFQCSAGCSATSDITLVNGASSSYWSPTQINLLVQASANASGTYYVQLNSNGANGMSFQSNPAASNGNQSNRAPAVGVTSGTPLVWISRADITSDQIVVFVQGNSAGATGSLTLELTGTPPNNASVILANADYQPAGRYTFSFERLSLPAGQFGNLTASWTLGGLTAFVTQPLSFNVIGITRFSTYNAPAESPCTGGTSPAWIISAGYLVNQSCTAFPANLNTTFMSQTVINGTGLSSSYGYLHEATSLNYCNYPQGGNANNTFYQVGYPTGTCNTPLVGGTSLATNPFPGSGPTWACSDQVLLVNTSSQTDSVKTVQDACPACSTASAPHIDSYSSSPSCNVHNLPDYGYFNAIRLR